MACLADFVMRGRRIEQHSLFKDPKLVDYCDAVLFVSEGKGGGSTLTRHFPPEEQLESAAARVRPLLLLEENVFHGKVM